jgi:diadenosine tetraphosphate (Ap4A) HIT family hydrolase
MKKQIGEIKNKKGLVNIHYAKSGMYKDVLHEIKAAKVCPFCPRTFKWHTKPILKTIGNWFVTESFQPYKNTAHHFLIIGKKHKENLEDLSALDWEEISRLQKWTVKKYHLRGGGIAMRFGDTAHTGATVSHLHLHLIVPKLKQGRAVPVWFPFG